MPCGPEGDGGDQLRLSLDKCLVAFEGNGGDQLRVAHACWVRYSKSLFVSAKSSCGAFALRHSFAAMPPRKKQRSTCPAEASCRASGSTWGKRQVAQHGTHQPLTSLAELGVWPDDLCKRCAFILLKFGCIKPLGRVKVKG